MPTPPPAPPPHPDVTMYVVFAVVFVIIVLAGWATSYARRREHEQEPPKE